METTKSSKDGQAFKMNGDGKEFKGEFTNKAKEKHWENEKASNDGHDDISTTMMDLYNKQLQLMTSFFVNPIVDAAKAWKTDKSFGANFLNGDMAKQFSNSFDGTSNAFSNSFFPSFDKIYKQMINYNNNLLSAFTSLSKENIDWTSVSKKYIENMENRLEAYQNMFNSLNESYSGKINSSIETNKKLMDEMSNQFNVLIKQNQKAWADVLEACQCSLNKEDKKTS